MNGHRQGKKTERRIEREKEGGKVEREKEGDDENDE